ncbi:MAG: hypothetical protein D6806_12100 [Deltaproteobacteria bacterium]|nr:MAG: hypothetical protein D6806_12100 [Deltaproteobacteria bacterium]
MAAISLRGLPIAVALAVLVAPVRDAGADTVPRALKGKIITSNKPIDIPTSARSFVQKLKKQDRKVIRKTEGVWNIHFVAFFKRPCPTNEIGIVVLDKKNEAVAVAKVGGQNGQKTLASQITVEATEFPATPHLLRIYYPKGNKPVTLAEKKIVLK